jgi:hypothetical protein
MPPIPHAAYRLTTAPFVVVRFITLCPSLYSGSPDEVVAHPRNVWFIVYGLIALPPPVSNDTVFWRVKPFSVRAPLSSYVWVELGVDPPVFPFPLYATVYVSFLHLA